MNVMVMTGDDFAEEPEKDVRFRKVAFGNVSLVQATLLPIGPPVRESLQRGAANRPKFGQGQSQTGSTSERFSAPNSTRDPLNFLPQIAQDAVPTTCIWPPDSPAKFPKQGEHACGVWKGGADQGTGQLTNLPGLADLFEAARVVTHVVGATTPAVNDGFPG